MSRNSAETSLRIFNSIRHYGLDITRAALTGGASLAPYLAAFSVDLFLSSSREDVQTAANAGFATGLVYCSPAAHRFDATALRVAFDCDAVLFSDEAEQIFQSQGLEAFFEHEGRNAREPLPEGPFAKVLRALAALQTQSVRDGKSLVRTALVTARHCPAHERVVRTLRAWNLKIDETYFMGGVPKDKVLEAFGAHIFFDDNEAHCIPASKVVPTARVLSPASNRKAS